MIVSGKTTIYKRASKYRNPNLRRMTDSASSGSLRVQYHLTPEAAKKVVDNPDVLLHHRLFNLGESEIVYSRGFRIRVEEKLGLYHDVYISEDISSGSGVRLDGSYRAPLLPFDLNTIVTLINERISGDKAGYKSSDFPGAIHHTACPFFTYLAIDALFNRAGELAAKLAGVQKILEVGSGLSVISFILSQLTNIREIHGVDIDNVLVDYADVNMRRVLQNKFGYDLSNVGFTVGDITMNNGVRIEDYDALIGWYPLGVSDKLLLSVFRRLRPGAMVLQLFGGGPVQDGVRGFNRIDVEEAPVAVFERV